MSIDTLEHQAGVTLFPYQRKYLEDIEGMAAPQRTCLYYRTGAGKSLTSLLGMKVWGYDEVLVIAPPSTHAQWSLLGLTLDIEVRCMSHAKFRMKGTLLTKHLPVIADEFHLFGGRQGQGWRKLDALARHLKAPLVLMSATPNYNDAERVYCVQHILSPHVTKGGYLQFLYENCRTEQNPFGMEPIVVGFKDYADAPAFLADLERVYYLPDERTVDIIDLHYDPGLSSDLLEHGYNRRDHRMIASRIEGGHAQRVQGLIGEDGLIRPDVMDKVLHILRKPGGVLLFATHATVAVALSQSLGQRGVKHELVTGKTTLQEKERIIAQFNGKKIPVLVGTSSLATGTDGMDKWCDTLLIVDDTDDDALRQQLIGRILPRGNALPAQKEVFRLVPNL